MSGITTPCLVQSFRTTDRELNVRLILERKSTRQVQKLQTLSHYVQQHPSGWKKRLELAELLYGIGHWKQAIKEYRHVIERQPRLIQIRLKLGKILQVAGCATDAIEVYEQVLPLCRNGATAPHIRGLISICKNQPEQAIKAFAFAASVEPENPAHWLALGQVQMSMEQGLAALAAFDQILSFKPDDLVALIHSHDALLSIGKAGEAEARLGRAEAIAPDDYAVLKRCLAYRLRMKWVQDGAGKQTKKMMTKVVKLAPHSAEAHYLKAEYYDLRGEWLKTRAIWQRFTEEHGNNPQGWYYYALFSLHRGDKQEAMEAISQAYNLEPEDRKIYQVLCRILSA